MSGLFQDIRYAMRQLRKSPGFTLAAVITLALAIGANGAVVFSVDGCVPPAPAECAERAEPLRHRASGQFPRSQSVLSGLSRHTLNAIAVSTIWPAIPRPSVGVNAGSGASSAWAIEATGNYFDELGIQPFLGRFFHPSDEHGADSAPYVVLSYDYWHSHFNDDRNMVGRVVQLDRHPYTILGVAPPEFRGTLLFFSPDLFVPMVNQPQIERREPAELAPQSLGLYGDGAL